MKYLVTNMDDHKRVKIEPVWSFCPVCGIAVSTSEYSYLSYPKEGGKAIFCFYCEPCDHEYDEEYTVGKTTIDLRKGYNERL